jgi:hypothetical protein
MECVAFMILREKCCHRGWSVGPPLKLNFLLFISIILTQFSNILGRRRRPAAMAHGGWAYHGGPRRLGTRQLAQPPWAMAVGPATVGTYWASAGDLPPWPTAAGPITVAHNGWPSRPLGTRPLAQPSWAMAVGPATVVGHGGRHGARRLVVKSDKFSRDVQFCKMIKKI